MWAVGNILSFLTGAGGRTLVIILAFLAWTAYQRMDATRDCEASQLEEELAETRRRMELARRIADEAGTRADETEAALHALEEETDAIISELRSSGTSCVIPDDVRERLLRIR